MKSILVFSLSVFLFYQLYAEYPQDKPLSGKLFSGDVFYPLLSDTTLKWVPNVWIQHPNLVVNNIIISDTVEVNCFRNHVDKTKLAKIKHFSAEEARGMGIQNVSKDGVLFVTTKKGYYFDFSCK